ncbi:MAG: S1C family serine protease [Solirubrobacteraceae bacterium]
MRGPRRPLALAAPAFALAIAITGCGSSGGNDQNLPAAKVQIERPVVAARAGFDPGGIYAREARGVVTVISIFEGSAPSTLGGGGGGAQEGLGSGFVVSKNGEIATNAHVVTNGTGAALKRAKQVFVKFGDGNQVPARIVGADPNEDVALIKVDPRGLALNPLPLGASAGIAVGDPVAAIGTPFGEAQSLSVGVISAKNRTIDSLTRFSISGAIQTDAAINHGNSGGPLVDAAGRVLGINSQIQSTGGGGEGVGFAVPIDAVKRSLSQLRAGGRAEYAYLGVSSAAVYPQLAAHFKLGAKSGAWVQTVSRGGPADAAGLRGGTRRERFQVADVQAGGDIITSIAGAPVRTEFDLSNLVAARRPGETVDVGIVRGGSRRTIRVKLGVRPSAAPR